MRHDVVDGDGARFCLGKDLQQLLPGCFGDASEVRTSFYIAHERIKVCGLMQGPACDRVRHEHRYRVVIAHDQRRIGAQSSGVGRLCDEDVDAAGIDVGEKSSLQDVQRAETHLVHRVPRSGADALFSLSYEVEIRCGERLCKEAAPDEVLEMLCAKD